MPSALLVDKSLVFTAGGWSPIGAVPAESGRGRFERVRVTDSLGTTRAVFIGTSLSCGIFAEGTTISDAEGKQWTAKRVAEDATIGEIRFEATRERSSTKCSEIFVARELWKQLVTEAAFWDQGQVWIRARRSTERKLEPTASQLWTYVDVGTRVYGRLKQAAMIDVLLQGRREQFVDGLMQVFSNDDNACELSRDSPLIGMTIVDYLRQTGVTASFYYDSLQHSAGIFLAIGNKYGALARGLCAFMRSEPTHEWNLSWGGTSWNPVSGGLLLKGM